LHDPELPREAAAPAPVPRGCREAGRAGRCARLRGVGQSVENSFEPRRVLRRRRGRPDGGDRCAPDGARRPRAPSAVRRARVAGPRRSAAAARPRRSRWRDRRAGARRRSRRAPARARRRPDRRGPPAGSPRSASACDPDRASARARWRRPAPARLRGGYRGCGPVSGALRPHWSPRSRTKTGVTSVANKRVVHAAHRDRDPRQREQHPASASGFAEMRAMSAAISPPITVPPARCRARRTVAIACG